VVLVVPWLLKREYRQHRALDDELPATYAKWLVTVDARLGREAGETRLRIVKVVIHPGEIETWASNTGRQVSERTRSDYADLTWRKEPDRWCAGGGKTPAGALAKQRPRAATIARLRQLARPAQKVIGLAESDVSLHKTGVEHEGEPEQAKRRVFGVF
jgi:hypothetical protein